MGRRDECPDMTAAAVLHTDEKPRHCWRVFASSRNMISGVHIIHLVGTRAAAAAPKLPGRS
jgi:hypothetical protein